MSLSVAIVIPTYNEAENIRPLVKSVLYEMPHARILVVDDNSPDGTGAQAERIATENRNVALLRRERKEGLGAAYIAGFQRAMELWPDAAYVIQMDADFSHSPAYLPDMIAAMGGADVAVGSRYVQGVSIVNWPIHRLLISWMGTAYAKVFTGLPITDCTSGFKCWRTETLKAIGLDSIRSNGYVFQIETSFRAWRLGYRLADVPIIFYERQRGQSKLNLSIAFEAFWVVLKLGTTRLLERQGSLKVGGKLVAALAKDSRVNQEEIR